MRRKGFVGAPFQLLISIVVFGMALAIGAYLFTMIECWKCNELLKIEMTNLREAIASVGKGDVNSRKSLLVELEDLGSCAKGIYIKKVSADNNLQCRSFCPNHPNSCWVVIAESSCGDAGLEINCADINGDMLIDAEPGLLGKITTTTNPWLEDAFSFSHTVPIMIEKTGPLEIMIRRPGS